MIKASQISLEELTNEELTLVAKYCDKCFDPVPVQDFVNRVRAGLASIYRFDGACSGVIVLANADSGLFVETVAGRGSVKFFNEILDEIKRIAKESGAKALYSYAARPGLEHLYKRSGIRPVATLYKEDLT